MFSIEVDRKEISKEFPEIKNWLKKMNKLKLSESDLDKKDAQFYYSYGSFVAKSKNTPEALAEAAEEASKMLYEQRLELELSKVRASITMKVGDFCISDKLPKGKIPEKVRKIVAEITKVKMLVECEYYENREVKESIPEIDDSIVSVEIERKSKQPESEEQAFEVDYLLEKISKNGFSSLTEEERKFLDRKSREL